MINKNYKDNINKDSNKKSRIKKKKYKRVKNIKKYKRVKNITHTKKHDLSKNNKHNILFYSSFIFITNVISALYKEHYTYSLLFLFLFLTSITVHTKNNIYSNLIDKLAIFFVFLYGLKMFYTKTTTNIITINKIVLYTIIIATFLSCIILYHYGFITKQFCFHPDINIGNKFHSLMHIIGSFGHHLLIFL